MEKRDSQRQSTHSSRDRGSRDPGQQQQRGASRRSRGSTKQQQRLPSKTDTAILFEKRLLAVLTLLTMLALILWIVAISTSYWYIVAHEEGIYLNDTQRIFIHRHAGLWTVCRSSLANDTRDVIYKCRRHLLFPTDDQVFHDPAVDRGVVDFIRTQVCTALLSTFMMIMAISASIYTFANPRYMYKRLASGLHFFAAATVLVVIEVLVSMVHYEIEHVPYRHPPGSDYQYGYSYGLGWIVFIFYMSAGIAFLVCSRKRKRDKAGSEEAALADEPTIIGR